jgi:crotonobetainyl-CoA:carnitine CoA-transferase CaiB-like acyl-CoA transferase
VPAPLEGLRVVDLSPNRVGAQVSQLFADYGAEVIWVEPPGGSPMRHQPAFAFWGRGKQSIELDLKSAVGREALGSLLTTTDVLIDTFRPGVLGRLGFDPATLQLINQRLVHTTISGFGSVGPYADLQGYEALVAAKLGVCQAFGRMIPGGRPPFLNVPWCSFPASQTALHGTLAALYERERSGLGQRVEASLAQAFTALDTWSWFEYVVQQKWPGAYLRLNNFDDDEVPTSPFSYFLLVALTQDGHWLQFAQVAPRLYLALMKELGLGWMLTDPEWAGIPVFPTQERRLAAWTLMLEAANRKSLAQWHAIFAANPDVFAEEFRNGPRVLDHPQMLHDATTITLEDLDRGPVRQPGPLVVMGTTPAGPLRSAPRLGAHQHTLQSLLARQPVAASVTGGLEAGWPADLPLAGVTVLEFAVQFAAPHGATLLTDLGARVIKVESLAGDPIRMILSFPETGGAKVMAGKESIAVDLGTPEGLAIVHELVKEVDIVMQGFRAGVVDRIGVGYAALRAINPNIVYLNAMGYGVGGPNGHSPAYAPSIGAAAGVARGNVGDLVRESADLTIEEIRHSSYLLTVGSTTSSAQADGIAALGVGTAMLLGLLARERGHGGQEMTTSMMNTNAHAMSALVVDYPTSEGEPMPDLDMRGLSALYRTYDASSGWVFLAALTQKEWLRLTDHPSFQAVGSDLRFVDSQSRAANDAELVESLAAVFVTASDQTWERDLRARDVGCVAVTTTSIEATLWGEGFGTAAGFLAEVEHPVFDVHPRMAPLVRFSRSATRAGSGVLLGSHTDALLTHLGRSAEQIADLRERNVVG